MSGPVPFLLWVGVTIVGNGRVARANPPLSPLAKVGCGGCANPAADVPTELTLTLLLSSVDSPFLRPDDVAGCEKLYHG